MTATARGNFFLDVEKWVEKAKENADQVVRMTALELLSRVVLRSPVGNPDLWKANAGVMHGRATFNQDVSLHNARIKARADLQVWVGSKRTAVLIGNGKRRKQLSPRGIARKLPLRVGKGYVGGRFRGNWYVSIGSKSNATSKKVDPGGGDTIARGESVLVSAKAGPPIYITNNLPYAVRLEYGWSKQAPGGMVRIAVAEFAQIVAEQIRALP